MKKKLKKIIALLFIMGCAIINLNAQTTVTPVPQNSSANPNNRSINPNSTTANPNGNYHPVTISPADTDRLRNSIPPETPVIVDPGNTQNGANEPPGTLHNSTANPNGVNPDSKTNPSGIYPDGTTNQNGNTVPVHRLPVDAGSTNRAIEYDTLQKNALKKYTEPTRKNSIAQPERLSPPRPERMRRDTLK